MLFRCVIRQGVIPEIPLGEKTKGKKKKNAYRPSGAAENEIYISDYVHGKYILRHDY
jgi:hypothetical protein